VFQLESSQKAFEIGDVKIGGLPGRDPTVLIGTMFYRNQSIVEDERKGVFDEEKAEEIIRRQEEFSDKTGNPCMVDVEGSTPQALERYIDFVADTTEVPLLMGGPTVEVRQAGLNRVKENGLASRVVYNSLLPGCKDEEIVQIKEAGVKSAILLAYNVNDLTSKGRVESIKPLLNRSRTYGVEKPLIDTFVLDVPSLGIAFRAFMDVKEVFGLPVGCGPHNAVGLWKGLRGKMGVKAWRPVVASVNAVAAAAGADFLLYGRIEMASFVFPAVAMVDAAYAFPSMQDGGGRLGRDHPIFRIA
jgi:tetrahydromethanopterin S-methyltransferase subunit H